MWPKTFFYVNHQDKGHAFVNALIRNDWREVKSFEQASMALIDSDVTPYRRDQIAHAERVGCKVFIYPHAARPNLFYDFWEPNLLTTANFVTTEVHKQVLRIIEYPKPVHVVGWSLCPLSPFRPTENLKDVLFAPIHANGQGWLNRIDKDINKRTFDALCRTGLQISVRYIGSLEACGLDYRPGVFYKQGLPDQAYDDIENTDLVVSHETFAYLAIARGKPTLMMDENVPPRFGDKDENAGFAQNWDKYKHLVQYPYWITEGDPSGLMDLVCRQNALVEQWKWNMIGHPFIEELFLWHVESYFR